MGIDPMVNRHEIRSPMQGPSMGLLRDYEPSCGPSFEALVTGDQPPPADSCHNAVAASFFPALVSSIQFARDVEISIFSEAERLV